MKNKKLRTKIFIESHLWGGGDIVFISDEFPFPVRQNEIIHDIGKIAESGEFSKKHKNDKKKIINSDATMEVKIVAWAKDEKGIYLQIFGKGV